MPAAQKTPFIFMASLSGFSLLTFDIYQPALPYITDYFNTTHGMGQLTLSLFLLVFGMAQLFWGPVIDHYGRRKILPLCMGIFFLGTLVCIFANSIHVLISGRIIQGLSVCCASVMAFSSTRDYEDSTKRAKAISHISMVVSASPIFAPVLGAFIFTYLGWRANFIFLAIICLVIIALGHRILHESPHWQPVKNHLAFKTLLNFYNELAYHKQLWVGIIICSSAFSSIMVVVVNAAYLIIDRLEYSPTQFSLLFSINGLMIIIGNYLGILLREYFSLKWNMRLGIFVHLSGGLMMLLMIISQGFTIYAMAASLLITLGTSFINPPTLALILTDFKEKPGSAAAVINTARTTLSAVLAALIGAYISYNIYILPVTLLIAGIICLIFSFYCKEN